MLRRRSAALRRQRVFSSVATATQDEHENDHNNHDHDSSMNGEERMNLFTAINNAMAIALQTDESAVVFGEDVAFGGVFRCSQTLREQFGEDRVFNTPLSENGIAGFAIGYASMGGTAIGEVRRSKQARDKKKNQSSLRLVLPLFSLYVYITLDSICRLYFPGL